MLNRVQLIGHVGNDPVVKDFNPNKVASFSIATTERGFTTKDGREIPDKTEWHNIIIWGGLTKVVEGYVRKGTKLLIEGKLRHRNYTDNNGIKRFISEVYADNLILFDSHKRETSDGQGYGSEYPEQNDGLPF